MTALAAVTFDFWNTLAYEERGHLRGLRLAAWAGILEDAGFAVERDRLHAVFEASWERFVARWTAGELWGHVEAAEAALEDLGFAPPAPVRDALVASFADPGEPARLHLADGVADALRALRGSGLRTGIVCDVGMTPSPVLRRHLDRHGVLDLFDHWSFSDEVGAYKPSPTIFRHALAGLGARPEEAAHVGDLRRTDVAGARALGMVAVRYAGIHDDAATAGPEAHHVVRHHAELPPLLAGRARGSPGPAGAA